MIVREFQRGYGAAAHRLTVLQCVTLVQLPLFRNPTEFKGVTIC